MSDYVKNIVEAKQKVQNYLSAQVEIAIKRVVLMDKEKIKHTGKNAFSVRVTSNGELYCVFRCDKPLRKEIKGCPDFEVEVGTISKASLRSGGLNSEEWDRIIGRCAKSLQLMGAYPERKFI